MSEAESGKDLENPEIDRKPEWIIAEKPDFRDMLVTKSFRTLEAENRHAACIAYNGGAMFRRIGTTATLEAAMALLIQNQAQLADDMAQIRRDFEEIKRYLIRHEQLLANLPDAIKEKIGFKQ
ncbi:MAG: hypothetical protein HY646_19730 [Acidobacteria bacterium]|nr:hypothetical protein [Acidobacteriota bacterium]